MKIVVTSESVVNMLLFAYVLLTPLLVIPVAGLLGASDFLFFPAVALALLVGRLRYCLSTHFLLLAFLILVGVSLHQTREFEYLVKWVRLIGITFPFILAAFSTITLRQVLQVFFWSGLLAIAVGIVLWWFDVALFSDEANQRIWLDSGESRVRAAGLFGNSTAFGSLIAIWTVACGMLAISEQRPNKMMLATVVVFSIIGLLSSTSRASLLSIMAGMGAGVICMFIARLQRRGFCLSGSTISLGIFSFVVAVGSLSFIVPQLMDQEWLNVTFSRFDPRAHESSNGFLSGRVAIWQDYLKSMEQWGTFGVGYKQGHLAFSISPHNQFLAIAAECGLLCLCALTLFVINVFANAILHFRDRTFESIICIAITTTFLVDSMGGEPLGSWQITPVTMLLIGICVSRFSRRDMPCPPLSSARNQQPILAGLAS